MRVHWDVFRRCTCFRFSSLSGNAFGQLCGGRDEKGELLTVYGARAI